MLRVHLLKYIYFSILIVISTMISVTVKSEILRKAVPSDEGGEIRERKEEKANY